MSLFQQAWQKRQWHQRIFALTLPMILSNITVPLVGTVDTMVMGRLPEASGMAAVGVGSALYLFLVGCFNFLRMGTTGFIAQAYGENNHRIIKRILWQSISLSLFFSIAIALLALPFSEVALQLMQLSELTKGAESTALIADDELFIEKARRFFSWRLLSLPATLLSFTLIGWFLGIQNARIPLLIMVVTNLMNMGLSILFVLGLHKGVVGAAQAAVIAEWLGVMVGVIFLFRLLSQMETKKSAFSQEPPVPKGHFNRLPPWREWRPLLVVNRDIFIRSLILQVAVLLISIRGGSIGEEVVAANMIIFNGFLISLYILDGFAHAVESLCGYAIGEKNQTNLHEVLVVSSGWAVIVALLFTLFFALAGKPFINAFTHISVVRETAYVYLPYLISLPLVGVASYLFDGLFIGATKAKEMRNSMLISFLIALMLGVCLLPLGNHGLWLAFLLFMLLRGGVLGWMAYRIDKQTLWW